MTSMYAESPKMRNRQLIGDLLFLAWCWLWARVGMAVNDFVAALADPGRSLSSAASSLADQSVRFERALPSFLNVSTDPLEDSARSLQAGADRQVEAVVEIAQVLGWAVALFPIIFVGLFYVTSRIRWWLTYDAVQALRNGGDFEKLLALRALAHAPYRALRAVSDDPVGEFDARRYSALAALQASQLGLEISAGQSVERPSKIN